MNKIKNLIMNIINGFCMALADSVPGVSGGTIAFLLGFYDEFISSIDDIFRGNFEAKKKAFLFLVKIGIGWLIGFVLSVTLLANTFSTQIYTMSSLFMGFIIFAIPVVIHEEKKYLKNHYKNIIFLILGIILVICISLFNTSNTNNINLDNLNIFSALYVFIAAMIAITAMILPGISGSTFLLIFGIYLYIINSIKQILLFNLSALPILIIFGLGIITGVLLFTRIIRKCLEKFRSQTIYLVIGLMLGSIYSIIIGPTSLDIPQSPMTFATFNIFTFLIGGIVILILEALKYYFKTKQK